MNWVVKLITLSKYSQKSRAKALSTNTKETIKHSKRCRSGKMVLKMFSNFSGDTNLCLDR